MGAILVSSILSNIRSERPTQSEPRLLMIGDQETRNVLGALSTETTRVIFERLYEQPSTPSELTETVDTSIQNVHYHLDKLKSAGLIESAGVQYSEKGREMTVYTPTSDPIVLAGSDDTAGDLRESMRNVGAIVLGLALVSLFVQWVTERIAMASAPSVGPASVTGSTRDGIALLLAAAIEPGALFFTGGIVILAAVLGWSRMSGWAT